MKFNPWHDVDPGPEAPDIVNVIMEIPKGSKAKYELDKASGMLRLENKRWRWMKTGMPKGQGRSC